VTTVPGASPSAETDRPGVWWRLGGGMVVALLLLTAVGYFRGPASTLAALHDAARARDSAAVAGLIDGEALRHSLGRLLLQQTGAALPEDGGNDQKLLSQFIVVGALVRPVVETLVTPEGILALLQGRIAPRPLGDATPSRTELAWSGLSTVRAMVMGAAGEPSLILVLRRHGLSWRLAGVEAVPQSSSTLKPGQPTGAGRSDGK